MGRKTDPGENHDPGNDQHFTPSLTQASRLENSLGHFERFTPSAPSDRNEFIKETLASTGATDGNAPTTVIGTNRVPTSSLVEIGCIRL
jgi:hypothetical protein